MHDRRWYRKVCRGIERTQQLLRKCLVALKDIERMFTDSVVSDQSQSSDEPNSPRNISRVSGLLVLHCMIVLFVSK